MSRPTLRALALAAGIFLVAGGCGSDVRTPVTPNVDTQYTKIQLPPASPAARLSLQGQPQVGVSEEIGPQGGVLKTASGHRLVFPAGAVAEPTVITMTDDATYVGVHLEPHGLQFPAGKAPVLTLSHDGANTSAFSSLNVVYTNDQGHILEVLPTDQLGASPKVTTRLQHFSGYILAGN